MEDSNLDCVKILYRNLLSAKEIESIACRFMNVNPHLEKILEISFNREIFLNNLCGHQIT